MSNFRYVSYFIQLQKFLETNCVSDNFQSGFRCRSCTETTLIKVWNDIVLSVNAWNINLLVLQGPTAAFDTADHAVIATHLL